MMTPDWLMLLQREYYPLLVTLFHDIDANKKTKKRRQQ